MILLCMLGGCGYRPLDPEEVVWEPREDVDEGFLCLTTEASPSRETLGVNPQRFEVGGRLGLHYDAAQCFSSCDRNIEVHAAGSVEANQELVVETTLRWENAPPQDGVLCALTCIPFDEVVELEPVTEEGTYTLVWGTQEVTFDVPSDDIVCLYTRVPGERED